MQRDIVEHRHDLGFLQVVDKGRAIVDIPQLDIEHVRVMHAVGRDYRQLDAAGLRQRQEAVIVLLPQCQTALVDAFRHFQLAPQVSGLQVRHQIAGTDVAPGIFVHLTTEELAAVGALLADDFRPIDQSRIVHQRRAAFAAGGVVWFHGS